MSEIVLSFIVAGTITVGLIITNICMYHSVIRTTSYPVIRYKEFKSIFNISPGKWDYYDEYIEYNGNCIRMSTLCGLLRAKLDLRNERNKKHQKESLEAKKKLIKQWQKDIEEYKQKAINDAIEQLKETGILTFTNEQKRFIKDAILQYCRTAEIKYAKEYSSLMEFAEKYANSLTINNIASVRPSAVKVIK